MLTPLKGSFTLPMLILSLFLEGGHARQIKAADPIIIQVQLPSVDQPADDDFSVLVRIDATFDLDTVEATFQQTTHPLVPSSNGSWLSKGTFPTATLPTDFYPFQITVVDIVGNSLTITNTVLVDHHPIPNLVHPVLDEVCNGTLALDFRFDDDSPPSRGCYTGLWTEPRSYDCVPVFNDPSTCRYEYGPQTSFFVTSGFMTNILEFTHHQITNAANGNGSQILFGIADNRTRGFGFGRRVYIEPSPYLTPRQAALGRLLDPISGAYLEETIGWLSSNRTIRIPGPVTNALPLSASNQDVAGVQMLEDGTVFAGSIALTRSGQPSFVNWYRRDAGVWKKEASQVERRENVLLIRKEDNSLFLSPTTTYQPTALTGIPEGFLWQVSLGPKGRVLMQVGDQVIRSIPLNPNEPLGARRVESTTGHSYSQGQLASTPDADYFLRQANGEWAILRWSSSGEPVEVAKTHSDNAWAAQISGDGDWSAWTRAGASGVFQVWRRTPEGKPEALTFFPSSSTLESISSNGWVTYQNSQIQPSGRYLSIPGLKPIWINSGQGRVVQRGSRPTIVLGNTEFDLAIPALTIEASQQSPSSLRLVVLTDSTGRQLQRSNDLRHWETIADVTPQYGRFFYETPVDSATRARYYRLKP